MLCYVLVILVYNYFSNPVHEWLYYYYYYYCCCSQYLLLLLYYYYYYYCFLGGVISLLAASRSLVAFSMFIHCHRRHPRRGTSNESLGKERETMTLFMFGMIAS